MSDNRTVNKCNLYADSATTFMELISSLPPLTFPSVNTYAENFSLRLSKCIDAVQRRRGGGGGGGGGAIVEWLRTNE